MNPHRSKLVHQQSHETGGRTEHQVEKAGTEFASVEEVLQFDARQVSVPPSVTARVRNSVADQPKCRSWWQRLFSRRQ